MVKQMPKLAPRVSWKRCGSIGDSPPVHEGAQSHEHPADHLLSAVVLLIWFVATGLTQTMIGITEWKLPGEDLMIWIMIANELPGAGAWAIGLLVGIQLIFYGIGANHAPVT